MTRHPVPRRGGLGASVVALALVSPLLGSTVAGTVAAAAPAVLVVSPGGAEAAARDVTRVGGRVLARYPLADAVRAELPAAARLLPGSVVTPDRSLRVSGKTATAATEALASARDLLGLDDTTHAGRGVGVAIVDTGLADVPALRGRVSARIDVSGDGAGDGYGHGTFMAGLVAGAGVGVAPASQLVDVRVAGDDGSTSLSRVLAGLEAVHARRERHDIRVLNLSLSSDSPLPWQLDPLTRALDALWDSGIVVVVPAGNDGPERGSIASPGVDPTLLTVGALDARSTVTPDDDVVPDWSARGPAPQGIAKPDLVAPGAAVVSLQAPGSAIDLANPTARLADGRFRGSGTSMSTAVVSGAVAVLLSARPELRPDEVKALVLDSAASMRGGRTAVGAGALDVVAALTARVPAVGIGDEDRDDDAERQNSKAWRAFAAAWAEGDEAATARAWALMSPSARAWAARFWALEVWSRASSWSDEEWLARAWVNEAWTASSWSASSWSGASWLARAWSARAWSADDWAARAWSARAWSASSWSARAWSARAWSARAWSAGSWSARAWSAGSWSARAWSARAWSGELWSARAWSARAWSAQQWG